MSPNPIILFFHFPFSPFTSILIPLMSSSTAFNWQVHLASKDVAFKAPPFGLASAPKSSTDSLAQLQKEYRDFATPDDYNQFALQIGPGTLGRVRIYAPQDNLSFPDPRMHQFRLHGKFSDPDHFVAHKFDLTTLLFFAQDTDQDLWFGWQHNTNGDYTIYAVDEQPKAPPPRKVAKSFLEFVDLICLGVGLEKAGLRKFTEDPSKDKEHIEPWDSDEEVEYDIPPQTFTSFAAPR